MAIRKKIITVPLGNVEKMAAEHNVSRGMVYNALNFTSNSPVAQIIRKEAMELYGGVLNSKVVF